MTDNQKQDLNQYCPDWANNGECDRNRDWMLPNCAKSCEKKKYDEWSNLLKVNYTKYNNCF